MCISTDDAAEASSSSNDAIYETDYIDNRNDDALIPQPVDQVEIHWTKDKKVYAGVVETVDDDGGCNVHYNDGGKETIDMSQEAWRFSPPSFLQQLLLHFIPIRVPSRRLCSHFLTHLATSSSCCLKHKSFPDIRLGTHMKSKKHRLKGRSH